jgi:histidinol-phosphatase (PHP family)
MNYLRDYHIHTCFSCDSRSSVEEVCRAALAQGMTEVAITDHADFEPLDDCCGYFRPRAYWRAIQRCREMFEGRLTIRAGVEFGEGHRFQREIAQVLVAHEYDFVLGSLHWAGGRPAWLGSFFGDGLGLDEGLVIYFDELARLAAGADYDVLAHLDFVRRAAHRRFGLQELDLRPHEERVRQVLRIVVERGKGLEVNTATVRRGIGGPSPPLQVLRWFREEGGRVVTLGSDAHRSENVGADFDRALAMVREAGFEELAAFEGRKLFVANER